MKYPSARISDRIAGICAIICAIEIVVILLLLSLVGCSHEPIRTHTVALEIPEDVPVAERPDYARHIIKHRDGRIELTP